MYKLKQNEVHDKGNGKYMRHSIEKIAVGCFLPSAYLLVLILEIIEPGLQFQ